MPSASPQEAPGQARTRIGAAVIAALVAALVVCFGLHLATGSVFIPLRDVVTVLLGGEPQKAVWAEIILQFRLPRTITAVLAGAALAISGLQMQTLFRNPLADPFVLGISAGASLGVAIVALGASGLGLAAAMAAAGIGADISIAAGASLGAAAVFLIVMLVARRVESNMTLLILGIMFGYVTSAVVSVLMHFSVAEQVHGFVIWTFGSFAGVTWGELTVLAPVAIVGLLIGIGLIKPLNALLLGSQYARSMGLSVGAARFFIIGSTSLLAGVVTAFCGPIGFLGIAVPHLCRSMLSTSDHRVLAPCCILLGAVVAILADIVAQLPGTSAVLPLNAVTSLVGAPFVIWIILRQRNLGASFGS